MYERKINTRNTLFWNGWWPWCNHYSNTHESYKVHRIVYILNSYHCMKTSAAIRRGMLWSQLSPHCDHSYQQSALTHYDISAQRLHTVMSAVSILTHYDLSCHHAGTMISAIIIETDCVHSYQQWPQLSVTCYRHGDFSYHHWQIVSSGSHSIWVERYNTLEFCVYAWPTPSLSPQLQLWYELLSLTHLKISISEQHEVKVYAWTVNDRTKHEYFIV